MTAIVNDTAAMTVQPSSWTSSGRVRCTGCTSLASSRMRSSVRTRPLLDAPPQRAIPAVRRHLDVGLGHPEPRRDFRHAQLLELEHLDHAPLMVGQAGDGAADVSQQGIALL